MPNPQTLYSLQHDQGTHFTAKEGIGRVHDHRIQWSWQVRNNPASQNTRPSAADKVPAQKQHSEETGCHPSGCVYTFDYTGGDIHPNTNEDVPTHSIREGSPSMVLCLQWEEYVGPETKGLEADLMLLIITPSDQLEIELQLWDLQGWMCQSPSLAKGHTKSPLSYKTWQWPGQLGHLVSRDQQAKGGVAVGAGVSDPDQQEEVELRLYKEESMWSLGMLLVLLVLLCPFGTERGWCQELRSHP